MAAVATAARHIEELPGPTGLPLLGQALQLERERMHQQLEAWARRFGPAFQLRISGRRFAVFSDPELVAAILRDRPEGFGRTRRLEMTAREFGFGGLFSANGADWRRQRSMVLAGLDPSHVKAFFPTLGKVTQRLAGRWRQASERGEAIDLQADFMRFTVDVTAGLAFGSDINTVQAREEVIQRHLDKILPALFRRLLAVVPYWRWFPLPSDLALAGHLRALRRAVEGFIHQARERLEREPQRRGLPENLIEAMIIARERNAGALSEQDLSGNVLTMLLAGEDTTANTLAWLVWLLHQERDALVRATAEARLVAGGALVLHHAEQLSALPFLDACAHEAMRLRPVAPFIVLQAAQARRVGDVQLRAGELAILLMRPAALEASRFAEPERFRPERWLEQETAGGGYASPKRVVMPFGAGPRICPGRYLALAEIKMAMAMLLACFDLESVATPDGKPVRERLAFTMAPVGLTMRLRPR